MSTTELTLFLAGDFVANQAMQSNFVETNVQQLIKRHDFRCVNWEAPITNQNEKQTLKAGPHIKQHSSSQLLLESGLFNVFSLANNHILDYGAEGLTNTITILECYGKTVGAATDYDEIYSPLVLTNQGLKVAMIAVGEAQFGCAKSKQDFKGAGYAWLLSEITIRNIIKQKQLCDFVVVLPHAGLEMEDLPLPEWQKIYRLFVDLGADLVVGTHPHIIQPKEVYKGRLIYYSLGNFFFNTTNTDKRWHQSLGLSCRFLLHQDGSSQIKIHEHWLYNNSGKIELNNAAENHFEKNNKILSNPSAYLNTINEIVLEHWQHQHRQYYKIATRPYFVGPNVFDRFKKWLYRQLIGNDVSINNEIMLYHNISIESNRFLTERALRLRNGLL